MKMLSLFSGVGMIDLAASWAGIETVAFCEIEEYPQTILRRRFPNVPIYSDVRELTNVEQYAYEPPRVIVGQKNRAKRLKALGNGCVPQQVYLVFAAIVEVENEA